ncbi:627_t:CDS:2 [Funneliformis mosseae]|uniref:627_t:CDS:1 n=1 Tax=Funneliformis mosseae TaxID=27381 RepID=A0A9N9F260_FUNMO|nr:627_t:CDS:2 [Funneliformis mosseae]
MINRRYSIDQRSTYDDFSNESLMDEEEDKDTVMSLNEENTI